MSKQTVKPDSVTQATFELWSEVNTWLNQYGVNQYWSIDPNDESQILVTVESGMSEMQAAGIDVFNMPEVAGAWCDWLAEYHIVIGPNQSPEPHNEDDYPADPVERVISRPDESWEQAARVPVGPPDLNFNIPQAVTVLAPWSWMGR